MLFIIIAIGRNMSGKKALYDDDDFYDEDDADEDYYGDYGEFDPGESQLVGKQSNKTSAKVAQFVHQRYSCKDTVHLTQKDLFLVWTPVQAPNKGTSKCKAKAGTQAVQPQKQAAAPAGASALARSLFSRKSRKGGEAVLQLGRLIA